MCAVSLCTRGALDTWSRSGSTAASGENISEHDLRPAREEDREFIFRAYEVSLRDYVEWAWGWDDEFQRTGFWRHHPVQQLKVIEVDGMSVGALHVEEQEACHYLRMIFLLPEYRGQGVGGRLVVTEIARARDAGKHLLLTVIKSNPAKALYERLGFEVVDEDAKSFLMRSPFP